MVLLGIRYGEGSRRSVVTALLTRALLESCADETSLESKQCGVRVCSRLQASVIQIQADK
jgi:hypothetical protein